MRFFSHVVELVESHINQAEVDFWKKKSVIDILRKPSQQKADKKKEETPSTDSVSSEPSQSNCTPFIQHPHNYYDTSFISRCH